MNEELQQKLTRQSWGLWHATDSKYRGSMCVGTFPSLPTYYQPGKRASLYFWVLKNLNIIFWGRRDPGLLGLEFISTLGTSICLSKAMLVSIRVETNLVLINWWFLRIHLMYCFCDNVAVPAQLFWVISIPIRSCGSPILCTSISWWPKITLISLVDLGLGPISKRLCMQCQNCQQRIHGPWWLGKCSMIGYSWSL